MDLVLEIIAVLAVYCIAVGILFAIGGTARKVAKFLLALLAISLLTGLLGYGYARLAG